MLINITFVKVPLGLQVQDFNLECKTSSGTELFRV